MAEDWTMVRLRRRTRQALQRLCDSRCRAADRSQMRQWWEGDQGPTADEMIGWLVRHVERDRDRAARSRRNKQYQYSEEIATQTYDVVELPGAE